MTGRGTSLPRGVAQIVRLRSLRSGLRTICLAAILAAMPQSGLAQSFFERLFGPPTPPAPVGRRGVQPQQRRVITR